MPKAGTVILLEEGPNTVIQLLKLSRQIKAVEQRIQAVGELLRHDYGELESWKVKQMTLNNGVDIVGQYRAYVKMCGKNSPSHTIYETPEMDGEVWIQTFYGSTHDDSSSRAFSFPAKYLFMMRQKIESDWGRRCRRIDRLIREHDKKRELEEMRQEYERLKQIFEPEDANEGTAE